MNKRKLGLFLLGQAGNFVFILVMAAQDFFGLHNPTFLHWVIALLILVIVGNVASLVYLAYQRYGKAGQSKV